MKKLCLRKYLLLVEKAGSKIIDSVKNGYLAVDGNYLLPDDSQIFKMRRKMRDSGIVVLSLVLDNKLRLVCPPILSVPGLLDLIEDIDVIEELRDSITIALNDQRKQSKSNLTIENIDSCAKRALKRGIKQEINKTPVIIVNIEELL